MATLAVAESLDELKDLYRRFAAIHHPDRGGSTLRMQHLNHQYQIMKRRLKKAANDEVVCKDDFSGLQVGTRLYVNTTLAEVIEVGDKHFRAIAVGRSRQALFEKQSGLGRNPRLRASFTPIEKPTRYH
ncbi:MAG: hypothetical protein V7745_07385 [Pseudomonadales bacterium]